MSSPRQGQGAAAAEVAGKLGTDPRATEMLLNALVAMGMLAKRDGTFQQHAHRPRATSSPARPTTPRRSRMHTVHLWQRWSTLTECVRAGTSVRPRKRADRGTEWTTAFIAAMHRNAAERAAAGGRGGGHGGRAANAGCGRRFRRLFDRLRPGQRADLRADLLDLETVVPIAQGHIEKAGLGRPDSRRVPATCARTGSAKATILSSSPPSATC